MAMLYLRNKPIGAISDGASGGGHVIENTSGTDMEQRSDLQFVGVYTEDDSANDRTKVNVVRTMTKAQMDALSAAEKVGFIRTSDEADNPYQSPSVVFVDDSATYTLPSVGNSVDVQKAVSLTGYRLVGIINVSSNTANVAIGTFIPLNNTNAFMSFINIGNSSQVGQSRNATWTNVFVKE